MEGTRGELGPLAEHFRRAHLGKGTHGEAKRGREQNERERPGAPWTRQATGSSQCAFCKPQGQSRSTPAGASRHQVPKEFTSRQALLWGLTPGESGDLLRPGCRQCGYGIQAGCFAASHGLCRAHRHIWGHKHRQVPRADLDLPLPQSTNGNWDPERW